MVSKNDGLNNVLFSYSNMVHSVLLLNAVVLCNAVVWHL